MSYGSKSIDDWVDDVHKLARSKGWWDGAENRALTPDEILAKLMLVVTEVSEAAEVVRVKIPGIPLADVETTIKGKPEGFSIEIADAVIRLFDLCGRMGIDLEQAIRNKHQFNTTRPCRHGKLA